MKITDKITLNLSGEEVFAPIVAHQGDLNSRVVECTLQKDGLPYTIEEGTTARATYRAASGVSDIHDAEIVGTAVVVPLIPSFLASPGTAHCDVQLYQSGKMLGTGRFAVLVSPAAAVGHDLEKSPEYQSFVAALADADQWKADTAEAISKATEATEGANTAAQTANAAAGEATSAKQAALDAAQTATTAAGTANTAATDADAATARADEAAKNAQAAADGAASVMPVPYYYAYTATDAVTEIPINVTGGVKADDLLLVTLHNWLLNEGTDYTRGPDGSNKIILSEAIQVGTTLNVLVLKFVVASGESLTAAEMVEHMASTSNPHLVTAEQVGATPIMPTKMLYQPTVTPGWDDADNYTTPGQMIDIPSAKTASSVSHLPDTDSGVLRVYSSLSSGGEDVVQTYECYTVSGWWVRRRVSGVWTPWASASGIQSGSNANGSWTKYPDGTMICAAYREALVDGSYNNTYYSPGWVFPMAFFAPPLITAINPTEGYGGSLYLDKASVTTTATGALNLKDPTATITVNTTKIKYYISAYGRWK